MDALTARRAARPTLLLLTGALLFVSGCEEAPTVPAVDVAPQFNTTTAGPVTWAFTSELMNNESGATYRVATATVTGWLRFDPEVVKPYFDTDIEDQRITYRGPMAWEVTVRGTTLEGEPFEEVSGHDGTPRRINFESYVQTMAGFYGTSEQLSFNLHSTGTVGGENLGLLMYTPSPSDLLDGLLLPTEPPPLTLPSLQSTLWVGHYIGGQRMHIRTRVTSLQLSVDPGTTGTGTDVLVVPVDPTTGETPASLVFENVTQSGTTTVTSSQTGPPPPTGFRLGNPPRYYDITTTAVFDGGVQVCLSYDATEFNNPERLRLLHNAAGTWEDVTTSNDPIAGVICGLAESLSPFALAETVDVTPPVIAMNVLTHELWPVNGTMILAIRGIVATDDEDPSPSLAVAVTSDEGPGDGDGRDPSPDWQVVNHDDGSVDVLLRAERNGGGAGRTYLVTITSVDASGNVGTAAASIAVPHDQRKGKGD